MITHSPSLAAASQSPVLLILSPISSVQSSNLEQLVGELRANLDPTIRIMEVSEATHPEVVRSFNFASLPAFALLIQGKELWHHAGSIDSPDIFYRLFEQIQQALLKNIPANHYDSVDRNKLL